MGRIQEYLSKWKSQGYAIDIPDELPECLEKTNLAPSYKKIALALLRNDHTFKSLGFTPPVSPVYIAIKRDEIKRREISKDQKNKRP